MGVSVEVCSRCGRMFQYSGIGSVYCPSCKSLDEEEFSKVRDYLNEHGAANMYEISQATGVTEKTVRRYLTESRLEIPEGSPIYINCTVCGCEIRSGRYCPDCARTMNDLNGALKYAGDKPKTPGEMSGKMHFIGDRDPKKKP